MSDSPAGRRIYLRDPSGLPSLESLFGWHSQYERMIRWHKRLNEDGSLDNLIAFFLNCYALRDWLAKTRTWKQNEIDIKIKDNFSMRLCKDICNRSKHLTLTMTPSVDANFLIVRDIEAKSGQLE